MTTATAAGDLTVQARIADPDGSLEVRSWEEGARIVSERPMPEQLIARYVKAGVREHALVRRHEDGGWYAEAECFPGVWAKAATQADARAELEEAAAEWAMLKILDRDHDLPEIDAINLNVI